MWDVQIRKMYKVQIVCLHKLWCTIKQINLIMAIVSQVMLEIVSSNKRYFILFFNLILHNFSLDLTN